MAFEAPSGLMGKPEEVESFEVFESNDITIYIAKNVLEGDMKNNMLNVYIEGYGRYTIEILE